MKIRKTLLAASATEKGTAMTVCHSHKSWNIGFLQPHRKGGYREPSRKPSGVVIPSHPAHRKFLQIQVGTKIFQFRALPFGLSNTPQAFTRILEAALLPLRKKGVRFIAYLDDICLLASSKEAAHRQGLEMIQHLETMGFVINSKKTCMEPMQKREFLGLNVDTRALTLSVPERKLLKIRREVKRALSPSQHGH